MNYLPFISWGIYGGVSAAQRAHFFVSWGLMAVLYSGVGAVIPVFMHYYRRLRG